MSELDLQKIAALLEMIEPDDNYTGGQVSYSVAKQMYDEIARLNSIVRAADEMADYLDDWDIGEIQDHVENYRKLRGEG